MEKIRMIIILPLAQRDHKKQTPSFLDKSKKKNATSGDFYAKPEAL